MQNNLIKIFRGDVAVICFDINKCFLIPNFRHISDKRTKIHIFGGFTDDYTSLIIEGYPVYNYKVKYE